MVLLEGMWTPPLLLLLLSHSGLTAPLDGYLPLNELFREHDMLSYDYRHILSQHNSISRRSIASQHLSVVTLSFHALGRNFTVKISPDQEIFTKDFTVETDKESVAFDRNRAYKGQVAGKAGIGKAGSVVTGLLLRDGRFEGKIVDGDEYFIERAEHYVPTDLGLTATFHSIIYRLADVRHEVNSTGCKFDYLRDSMKKKVASKTKVFSGEQNEDFKTSHREHGMYSKTKNRQRRAIDPTKTMCELYIQADHLYYEKWGSSIDTVVEHLTAYVQAANSIYQITDFDGDGVADDITFAIKKLKVWTDSADSSYPFADNLDVNNFLEVFSAQDNFDSFCLAYTFTHRDFNDGTLGLAWPGNVDGSGGVCTKYALYGGDSTAMSLNTGIVTTLNFQRDVIFSISQITFAHELGHNLGSLHDAETSASCAPGNDGGGNYIMFPKATDGDQPNNNMFSECSISAINDVLNAKARHDGDDACFKAYSATLCGNKVVEDGEDCDCGWDDECGETCCNPQMVEYDPLLYTPCTYTNHSLCSPSEGACCGDGCTPRSALEEYECRSNTSCTEVSMCDGTTVCPDAEHKANGTDCDGGMVCYSGECSTSICQAFGYEQCQCMPEVADDWNDERLCKLCCTYGVTCTPSSEIPTITKGSSGTQGQPCFEYQGYCDVFFKCRKLDPMGTINSLKKILTTEEGIATVTEWVTSNWYIVAASILGFVILMAISVKFGAKHEPVMPPGSNKVAPK